MPTQRCFMTAYSVGQRPRRAHVATIESCHTYGLILWKKGYITEHYWFIYATYIGWLLSI